MVHYEPDNLLKMTRKKTALVSPDSIPPLRKAAAAIHVSGELSLLERKLVNVLLLNAIDKISTQNVFTIPTEVLSTLAGRGKSKNVDSLKAALETIGSTRIEFNLLETEQQPAHWRFSNMLGGAEIKGGICRYEYPKMLTEMLADPDVYALIDLNVQNEFKKGYALSLYENCLRFKRIGKTRFVPLGTWRKLLGAQATTYDDFKRFASMVLKPAVAEVNKVSNIIVEPEYRKEGRKVVEMRFLISEKHQGQLAEADFPDAIEQIRRSDTYRRMMAIDLGDQLAVTWIQADPERAAQTIAYVEAKLKDKAIKKNIPGYARRVYESGSSLELFPPEVEAPAPDAPTARTDTLAADDEEKERRARAVTAAVMALTIEQTTGYVEAYVGQGGRATTYNAETGKFRNAPQKVAFISWLRPQILAQLEDVAAAA
ncbi:replication initiation protein [Paraburkholderia tropica]|uniref:replication initiation protein n=1 Tax=Paraburkholderia tropica TaxID=92647 RepID=UPI002AB75DFC|nr:replication initiation protein [Paraburkholderia tropica]